jgi:BirA family biotin operon repressor/biotin-[acetyl-CoA-carboxylase] ligase
MPPRPFDIRRFEAALDTRAFGRAHIFESSVGSTMDLARDAARGGAAEGFVSFADEQTAGRGRLGRSWVTPPAVNLASTLVLRPPVGLLRQIAMIAPLAVCEAVSDITGIVPDLKWPNDVQIGGKKLAGILIETEMIDGATPIVLVGAGINVNFDPRQFDEIKDLATSLAVETDHETDREALFASYLRHFERLYEGARAGVSVRDRWRERLVTLGQRVTVTAPGGVTSGVAEDVDGGGALLVRTDTGTLVAIEAGDVTLRA